MWQRDLERGLLLATVLMTINLGIGLIATIILQELYMSMIASGGAFLEIAILLIVGACLMSRQPLHNKDRYNADGSASSAWRLTLYGRQMLFAAAILFLYLMVLGLVGYFVPF
ncbi:MAG: hypothetical protein ACFFE6_04745 [Candidatus Thorarchaeota archaeon]